VVVKIPLPPQGQVQSFTLALISNLALDAKVNEEMNASVLVMVKLDLKFAEM